MPRANALFVALFVALLSGLVLASACAPPVSPDAGRAKDAGSDVDAGPVDGGSGGGADSGVDAGAAPDAGADAGSSVDGGVTDGGATDGGATDGGAVDGGIWTVPLDECPESPALPAYAAARARGAVATCGDVTLEVAFVEEGIAQLRYTGPASQSPARSFAVLDGAAQSPEVFLGASAAGSLALCTAELSIHVDDACRVVARDASGHVLIDDGADGGYEEDGLGGVSLRRRARDGERFYGLGEKTGALDRRGRSYTFWNTDAYVPEHGGFPPDADPLYQAVPFYTGLEAGRAYGVFIDNTFRSELDVAASEPAVVRFSSEGGLIDQYLFAGPRMGDVLERYTRLTGRAPRPPRWALGYHQSRWGWYPDTRVAEVMNEFRARQIPADGIWLDIQHMDGFRSFTFDPVGFPAPETLLQTAASLGFKPITIVDPGIKQDESWSVYQQGIDGGLFLETPQGAVYVGEVWPGAAVFPDFSDAATRTYWAGHIGSLRARGVRGIWIDMNEPSNFIGGTVPNDLVAENDGAPTTMAEMHNVYAHNMARATREGLLAAAPGERPFVLTRAGYAGTQRYAAMWTGDAPSTFDTLAGALPMLLGVGLSGQPFCGSDVGGYSGNATGELFARWMALGVISPFFRGHVTTGVPDQEPWAFGVEVEHISRTLISERYRLLPYLYSLFDEAHTRGAPLLRPLVWEFQDDPVVETISDQAMLGPSLLYAPVLEPGATTRTLYLPEGRWLEYRSGALYEGPGEITVDVTLEALPAFLREGAIVPHAPLMQWSEESPVDPLTLDVFPGTTPSSFALYEDDGTSFDYEQGSYRRVSYSVVEGAAGATLTASAAEGSYAPPARTLLVRFRRTDQGATAVSLDGVALEARASLDELLASGQGWFFDEADLSLLVAFPDRDAFTLIAAYDPARMDPAPPVAVSVEVRVPAGTPTGTPIHIATSANGWQHQPLTWAPEMDRAYGSVLVPRGRWFEYKYTRGDWANVEKWSGCVEATNRYAFGAAHPGKRDSVDVWADACP